MARICAQKQMRAMNFTLKEVIKFRAFRRVGQAQMNEFREAFHEEDGMKGKRDANFPKSE